jgi:hypothetical protein
MRKHSSDTSRFEGGASPLASAAQGASGKHHLRACRLAVACCLPAACKARLNVCSPSCFALQEAAAGAAHAGF